ncbi:MAG: phosphodiester glycosidase family protein [Chitinophagaceae bacterium]
MSKCIAILPAILSFVPGFSQINWYRVDALFQPLPSSVQVWVSTDSMDGKPSIAYAVVADLKDKNLSFHADTSYKRRLTPSGFYNKNNQPLLVVNTTFFSFSTHQNLNLVIKDGRLVAYNIHSLAGKGKDTFTYRHPIGSAIGISRKREADIAWLYTDSSSSLPLAVQVPVAVKKDSLAELTSPGFLSMLPSTVKVKKWKMQDAVGGGPVLVQQGEVRISNNEELKFAGKAINDRHPRTAMGYTSSNELVFLVVEGRNPGKAEGVTLLQEARLLQSLGCVEALNLDGGGSSMMLINGKETIRPSDKEGQRAVPGVFMIQLKKR